MALDQSVVSELLVALRSGDGVDLVREAVRLVLQELIEAEATQVIGAAPYERTGARVTERNGHRARTLATKAGDIEVGIPKLRKGSFFPQVLEPRRRIDQALYAVVMEAYVKGVSTRSVDDLVAALGVSSGISRSEVSRICAQLDEVVDAFRTRRLDHARFPYVYLTALTETPQSRSPKFLTQELDGSGCSDRCYAMSPPPLSDQSSLSNEPLSRHRSCSLA